MSIGQPAPAEVSLTYTQLCLLYTAVVKEYDTATWAQVRAQETDYLPFVQLARRLGEEAERRGDALPGQNLSDTPEEFALSLDELRLALTALAGYQRQLVADTNGPQVPLADGDPLPPLNTLWGKRLRVARLVHELTVERRRRDNDTPQAQE